MVFVGGPRQVGKTTLALQILGTDSEEHPSYLNFDIASDREKILAGYFPAESKLVVLDEIHKYRDWRNLIKGFFDKMKSRRQFLVTGSARLDYYRRGGDSLQGRYHYYRMHPLHLDEVDDQEHLLEFGGYPEPFLAADHRTWSRWQNERRKRVIQEDLISLEMVRELSKLDLLASILPSRVGSLLSVKNLAQDLAVAFETADRWTQILENLYYCFRIKPMGQKVIQTTKKERKLYMWDWSLCTDPGARLENFVASYLLKYCHFREDYYGEQIELRFLRDRDQREIDFVIVKDGVASIGIECKSGSETVRKNIKYFSEKTEIPLFYQFHSRQNDFETADGKIRCLPISSLPKIFEIKSI